MGKTREHFLKRRLSFEKARLILGRRRSVSDRMRRMALYISGIEAVLISKTHELSDSFIPNPVCNPHFTLPKALRRRSFNSSTTDKRCANVKN